MVNVAEIIASDRDAYEMAMNMREGIRDGTCIGIILDRIEDKWNAAEKSKLLADKNGRHPMANYRPNKRPPYQAQSFPRDEVRDELVKLYPWVDPQHPGNPSFKFYQRQCENMGKVLQSGDATMLRRAGATKSWR